MSNKNGRAVDAPQRAFYRGDVSSEGVQAILGCYHLVPVRVTRGNNLAKAGSVGPVSLAEHDALFRFSSFRFHTCLPFLFCFLQLTIIYKTSFFVLPLTQPCFAFSKTTFMPQARDACRAT